MTATHGSSPRGKLELFAGSRRLEDLERVTGGRRRVNDQGPRRALARRALVLVGPAAVIEPAFAGEKLVVPVGIVVEHQEDLALEVDAFVIVPTVLRRLNAVADEDHLSVADLRPRRVDARRQRETPRVGQGDLRRATGELPRRRRLRGDADHRERLLPRAPGTSGLEACSLELGGEVQARELVAAASGTPPFESVGREKADRRGEAGGVDTVRGGALARRGYGCGKPEGGRRERCGSGQIRVDSSRHSASKGARSFLRASLRRGAPLAARRETG